MTNTAVLYEHALTAPPEFLARPSRDKSESPGGFLLRLAHENGIRPIWCSTENGCRVTSPGLGIARWCPHCLSTPRPYWKGDWIDGPPICSEHCCWLLDRCSGCGVLATWRRLGFKLCKCEADLARQPASPWSADLQVLLHTPDHVADRFPEALDSEQRWALMEVLGALDHYGLRGKPIKRSSSRLASHQQAMIERGASIVVHAAEEMPQLLERLRAPCRVGQQAQLVREAWPGLLRLLTKQLDGEALAWAQREIEQHADGPVLQGVAIQRRRLSDGAPTGARGLAARVGVRVERVPRLLADCGLEPPVRQSKMGRRMLVVSDAVVTSVREHLDDLLPARSAQRRFGLTAARLNTLTDAGLVRRVRDRYSASSIQLLLDQIAVAAKSETLGTVNEHRRWCSLHHALQLHVGHRQTAALFMALQAGSLEIRRVGHQTAHAHDLLLLESEVKAWSRASAAPGEELTIPQAAALLGLKQEVTYHLVRVGLLATSRGFAGRRMSRVISRQEVERFRREVSPLSEAARAHGVDHRSAKCWALERRFTFVSGPGIDGGRQFFVRATCS